MEVTVGGMAALSHLTHRDMGKCHNDVGNIIDHVIAAFALPYAADAAVEPIWTLLVKRKGGVSLA